MSKVRRPAWFKMFLHQKALIDSVPNESAGIAIKAVFAYFDTGNLPDLDPLSFAVFASIKPYIDESFDDFKRSSEYGKAGNAKRWGKEVSPPDTPQHNPIHPLAPSPEAEAEAEAEGEGECKADKPPTRSHFSHPTVDQVKSYCTEKGYTLDADRFVDYYTANGWRVGKNPMKDWKAAVRTWSRKEQPNGKTESKPAWTIGTVV